MASKRTLRNDQSMPDPDAIKAARKFVLDYSEDAIKFLVAECDPISMLREACDFRGQDYHQIMSQSLVSEDDSKSQSSRQRTFSSDSKLTVTSNSSAAASSSDSGNRPPKQLWVMPENGSKVAKTLTALCLPKSDCLIRIDAVCNHLGMQYEQFSTEELVCYHEGHLSSSGTVSIEWARKSDQLGTKMAQQTTFYVVDDLPGAQVVFGDSEPEAIPVDHPGGLPNGLATRSKSYRNAMIPEKSPGSVRRVHGDGLQSVPYTNTFTEDSTRSSTIKAPASRAGQVPRERQSEKSKIPKPKTSASSVSSAFTNQSRTHDGRASRASQGTPTVPPPVAQVGLTSGITVDISYGECEMGIELQLDAPGTDFFNRIYREIRKKTKLKLNRQTDVVRFTRDKNDFRNSRWVSLQEHRVKKEWEKAVNWLRQLEEGCDIYAVVGPEPDDDDDDDDPPD